MTTPEPSLFEHTRRHVERVMLDVTGDNDFMPIMAVRDHRGELIACGLMMPGEDPGKDVIADMMASICAIHRATEVAFTSAAWIVSRKDGEPAPDLPPSQCADRQEIAMITMLDAEGNGSLHTAPIIRENNLAGVGLWEEQVPKCGGQAVHAGRFPNAIRRGMGMGAKIPADMAEYLDSKIAAGEEERLIRIMVGQMQQARADIAAADSEKGVQN